MNRNLFTLFAFTLINFSPFAIAANPAPIEVGDPVPNLCWKDLNESTLCLGDAGQKIRLLVYGSGWCPDCRKDIEKLVSKYSEFKTSDVVFYNLLAEGFHHKDLPDTRFLKEWAKRYSIPFAVAASPRDPGNKFFEAPHYIPNYVIVDRAGKLAYKSNDSELDVVLEVLQKLLEVQP